MISLFTREKVIAATYAVTVFASASLLFFVQPMFAKMVLPYLGGAPAVWTTAMLFFQSALLAGYAYAHLIATRLTAGRQMVCHAAVWAVGLIFLPIAIPDGWSFDPAAPPVLQTLAVFTLAVGWPFFALAANAPLLQKWYARSGGPSARDPYHLYAASNAGSMLALLAFPLAAEPLLGTRMISSLWAGTYLALGAGLALCALWVMCADRSAPCTASPVPVPAERYRPAAGQWARWIGLAFVPSSMMLGISAVIASDLGAFPLIWVIPLALYLLTFVLAFSSRLRPPETAVVLMFLVSVPAAIVFLATNQLVTLGLAGFAVLFVAFFSTALLFHMRLHDARPPESGLTPFYFAMSLGGAFGGLFNSIIAPLVFRSALEAPIIFALAGLALSGPRRPWRDLAGAAVAVGLAVGIGLAAAATNLLASADAEISRTAIMLVLGVVALMTAHRAPLRFAATAAGLLAIGQFALGNEGITERARSFFGVYVVRDSETSGLRQLSHGTTLHGQQFIADLGTTPRILGYYHPNAPLGQIFGSDALGPEASVGVVGLGVGALSCYARPGQTWRFYEIDRLIDQIARDPALFSYMDRCAGSASTILGDARVRLAADEDIRFDVLVIDAYSSDAIPIHLITIEALKLYLSRLAPGGVVALHTSNRYFDLPPLLANAAHRLGATALAQFRTGTDAAPIETGESPSQVVLMATDPAALARFSADPRWQPLQPDGGAVWTDDHASLLAALRPQPAR